MLQPTNVRQKTEECLSPNPQDGGVVTPVIHAGQHKTMSFLSGVLLRS